MRFFTTVYTLLLLYTIAALLFWGFSLQRQSRVIYGIEREALQQKIDSVSQPQLYRQEVDKLNDHLSKRNKQYIGEGSTLLLILLIGAAVVFTSLQRNVRFQRQQNNFMLAVTHELKSPIAGMKLSIQTLQKHKLSEAQESQLLARCIQEADRLADLCNNMLITSQIEGRQYKTAREKLSLSELIENAAAVYSSRYPDRIVAFIQPDCMVQGDMLLLQMTITNLLENAIKYTPPGSPIEVRLEKDKREVCLQVSDSGHGIQDSEKSKIFTKFYRIGDEATRRTKGTGLGLYLTSRIVRQHKGRLTVKDNIPTGAIFQITLPLA
jgi:signal transduction histidine kinase